MIWPFKTIKQKSEWPFHSMLVGMAGAVLSAPSQHRTEAAMKTIERCVRLGAKLAVEFGVPPCVFVKIAEAQIVREGGKEAAAHLAAHKADHATDAVAKSDAITDAMLGFLTGPGKSN
jgi:hypothetical protein